MIKTFQRIAEHLFGLCHRVFGTDYGNTVAQLELQVTGGHQINAGTIDTRDGYAASVADTQVGELLAVELRLGYENAARYHVLGHYMPVGLHLMTQKRH